MGKVIEESSPRFPAGHVADTNRAYHAVTRDWIVGEIVRRVDPAGRTTGEFLRDEVGVPLGADVHFGVEESSNVSDLVGWDWRYVLAQSVLPAALGRRTDQSLLDFVRFYWRLSSSKKATAAQSSAGGSHPLIEGVDPGEMPDRLVPIFNRSEVRRAEAPSINAHCSARGMAKVAACLAGGGTLGGVRIMREEAAEAMMAEPTKKKDAAIADLKSYFTQGGINLFRFGSINLPFLSWNLSFPTPPFLFCRVFDDDVPYQAHIKGLREGFAGWQGLGGSVMQWHPEEEIGFAYAPTLVHYYDMSNTRAGQLQREVVNCIRNMEERSG